MNGARGDVWRVSLETGGSAEVILSGPFPTYDARISPDGQWLAYVSEETGRAEVSVRAMSGRPRVAWSPTEVAANRSGDAMDTNCSTSILKAVFVADRSDARRAES